MASFCNRMILTKHKSVAKAQHSDLKAWHVRMFFQAPSQKVLIPCGPLYGLQEFLWHQEGVASLSPLSVCIGPSWQGEHLGTECTLSQWVPAATAWLASCLSDFIYKIDECTSLSGGKFKIAFKYLHFGKICIRDDTWNLNLEKMKEQWTDTDGLWYWKHCGPPACAQNSVIWREPEPSVPWLLCYAEYCLCGTQHNLTRKP